MEKTKDGGITLISLIITIIILLILVGIMISVLSENNLFKKTEQASQTHKIAQYEEELKRKVYELQIQKMGAATLQDFVDYLESDEENEYVISLSKIATVSGITDVQGEKEIYVQYKGYTFKVTDKFDIEYIENRCEIESTYEIISINENKYSINILFSCNEGIQTITTPIGNVIQCNNKRNVSLEYEIELNELYEFKIRVKDEEQIYKLDSAKINALQIVEKTTEAYPILTKKGIVVGKTIDIETEIDGKKYYSVDNGENWKEKIEDITITKETNLKAKVIVSNEITPIISKNISFVLASDAIGENAYDKSDTSYDRCEMKKIRISEELIGDYIALKLVCPMYNHIYCNFYDKDDNLLEMAFYWHTTYGIYENEIKVPENAAWIKFDIIDSNYQTELYYIEYSTMPKADESHVYPYIGAAGIYNGKLKINYFETAQSKLYSFNNSDWIQYPEDGISGINSEIVYAKSIDKDGKESRVLKYIREQSRYYLSDDEFRNITDNNDETYYELDKISAYYFDVEKNLENKTINFRFKANLYSRYRFTLINDQGEEISSSDACNNYEITDHKVNILPGTTKIKIYFCDRK